MDDKESIRISSVSDLLNGEDVLSQHDSKLDLCIAKISAALRASDVAPYQLGQTAVASISSSRVNSRDFLILVFRKTMLDVLQPTLTADPETRKTTFELALKLVDASISLVAEEAVDGTLPPFLLELLFTFNTQAELARQIPAIRQRFEAFHAVTQDNKVLFMIKAAMSCINRDKPGSNPRLTGYFRLMLAAALPTWHVSGLSRRIQFNNSNVIDYDSILNDQSAPGFDAALYRSFWRAQSVLSNPSLAESLGGWRDVSEAISHVLSAFETLQPERKVTNEDGNSTPDTIGDQTTIPKYLTSPAILRLQLKDIRVRRQVLTQYAILLHLLELGVPIIQPVKPSPAIRATTEQFRNLFKQGDGSLLKARVFHVLERDSSKFRRFVTSLLQKERRWVEWKKKPSGFNHLLRKGVSALPSFKRRKTKTVIGESEFEWVGYVKGWKERQSAWELPPQEERFHELKERGVEEPWSVEIFMMELKEDMRDTEITNDMKRKNDSKYVWRTLRTLFEEKISGAVQISSRKGGGCDLDVVVRDEMKLESTPG